MLGSVMSVDSVTAGTFQIQPLKTAGSIDKSVKGATETSGLSLSNTAVQPQIITDPNTGNKVSQAKKPLADTGNDGIHKQPVRAMSHIVETYNPQGKLRIKFEDSHNNVIYQIPTEMVAKTQDLMTNTQAATDVKG